MKHYLFFVLWLVATHALAAISVREDVANTIVLQQPAQRIVTLAPHVTELVLAAGGDERIVSTVSYGDYPLPYAASCVSVIIATKRREDSNFGSRIPRYWRYVAAICLHSTSIC